MERAEQQRAEGGRGFCPLTAGAHAFKPSFVMRQKLCSLFTDKASDSMASVKSTNATITTSFLCAPMSKNISLTLYDIYHCCVVKCVKDGLWVWPYIATKHMGLVGCLTLAQFLLFCGVLALNWSFLVST